MLVKNCCASWGSLLGSLVGSGGPGGDDGRFVQAIPTQSVAQYMKSCSWIMFWAWSWLTSPRLPNSPCPYRAGRAPPLATATCGMLQVKYAVMLLPGIQVGAPCVSPGAYKKREPGGQPGRFR